MLWPTATVEEQKGHEHCKCLTEAGVAAVVYLSENLEYLIIEYYDHETPCGFITE